ncbi:MerR family transcriptional regulator [bacterium AH-315-O15]|nr:MerR family transcriptional regulator [bacterium AH-315-O15]
MVPKFYKAADVCESTGLQPYVLRSWEKEFPGIGVQQTQDSARRYRQSDVEQVLRIKQLVFGEGLTLAGARRRLEASPRPANIREAEAAETAEVLDTLAADARARIAFVRSGLRSILDVLSKSPGARETAELRHGIRPVDRKSGPSARDERTKTKPSRPRTGRGKASPSKRAVPAKRMAKRV